MRLNCRRLRDRFALAAATLVVAATVAVAAPPRYRPPEPLDAARLRIALDRLGVLGSILYVAAHPDDENTALLAYLGNDRHVRTGYVALTRGDGGQNRIGTELGPRLGIIRTQELLAARRIDGAEQYFTRALDFGYSKTPEETLEVWDRDAVLADLVRVIRTHRPDVMVTRFTPTVGGHGHHLASARLAAEAFVAAGDPDRFTEQLAHLEPWQPTRMFWNDWRGELDDRAADAAPRLAVDLGTYSPLLGESFTELAARSRSMHKSQAFGRAGRRGARIDHLELSAGELPAGAIDPFAGIDLTWGRVKGGERVASIIERACELYEPSRPHAIVPILLEAYGRMRNLEPSPWVEIKSAELRKIVRAASGLWLEAMAPSWAVSPGGELTVTATVELADVAEQREPSLALAANEPRSVELTVRIPDDAATSDPYWLRRPPARGTYLVDELDQIGQPESAPALVARFVLDTGPHTPVLVYDVPVSHRWTDLVRGELYRAVEIVPPVGIALDAEVYLFTDETPRTIGATVHATSGPVKGSARLRLPAGFTSDPETVAFDLSERGGEAGLSFEVTPPAAAARGSIVAEVTSAGRTYTREVETIAYDHIPAQTHLPEATAIAVRVDIGDARPRVGYVMGAGDKVPEALTQAGYDVVILDDDALDAGRFDGIDVIVMGIRAYNTRARLAQQQERLLLWVASGGTLVVQYNVSRNLYVEPIGPYAIGLSRDRVTVEEAEVRLLAPEHPLLGSPNRIGPNDFSGWVQERGLYFANEWDESHFTPLLGSHDPGEEETRGSLLVAPHGDGLFIYTGLSFFRQLPAGVPGAYRLFANLLAARAD